MPDELVSRWVNIDDSPAEIEAAPDADEDSDAPVAEAAGDPDEATAAPDEATPDEATPEQPATEEPQAALEPSELQATAA